MTKSAVAALENTEKETLLKNSDFFFFPVLLSGRASSEVSCTSRKV